jgi:aerobic-type carbon monoxide dehydrogenase small subunit (CoxS/CutS family)
MNDLLSVGPAGLHAGGASRPRSSGDTQPCPERVSEPNPCVVRCVFIDEQAAQCAFCVNGMIMGALGWLETRKAAGNVEVPTDGEIRDFLSGASPDSSFNYICRCGAHNHIVAAIESGAKEVLR